MNKSNRHHSPYVSIVMPVYNGARTLMDAVNSVLKQTYRDFELIICNDASTDETDNILNSITDDRVRVIHNHKNLGEGPTRDKAIERANGVWLAVIDSDDAWAPERLEVMLREVEGSTDIMIFDNLMQCHDTPSGMVPWRIFRDIYAFGCNGINSIDVPLETFVCSTRLLIKPLLPLMFIKQNNVRHCCQYGADTGFFLQLLSLGLRLRYLPTAMYYYRITPGAMTTSRNRFTSLQEVLEISISYFRYMPNVQAAINKKISLLARTGHYMSFVWALKRKEFIKSLRLACQSPWIVPKFIYLLFNSLPYHLHRIRHGGFIR